MTFNITNNNNNTKNKTGGGYHVTLNRCADTSLLCNPNLLDNSNFQINQRDIAGLQTGGTWLQDRWFCATGNIEVMDGYIILKNPAALGQRLEEGLETGYYTISAKTDPGHTVSFSLGNWAGTEQNAYAVANADGYVSATLPLTHENNKKSFIYIHAAGSDVPIYKVKLEHGDVCTLRNGLAPNLATELSKCHYYYRRINCTRTGIGVVNTSLKTAWIQLPYTMRMLPTVTISSDTKAYDIDTNVQYSIMHAVCINQANDNICLQIDMDGTIPAGHTIMLQGGYIELSAEL